MSIKKITLITLLMVACVSGFAQTRIAVYGGAAFPLGAMKDGNLYEGVPTKFAPLFVDGTKCYAGAGFNLGVDAVIPISDFGLGVLVGADFFYNGYNSAIKEYFNQLESFYDGFEEIDSYKVYRPKFMNIPILVGLNYRYDFSRRFGIFAEAAAGPNIRFISKYGVLKAYSEERSAYIDDREIKYTKTTELLKYKAAMTFGYKVGIGVMLFENISLSLDYYGLGSAKVNSTEHIYYNGRDYSDQIFNDKENEIKGNKSVANSEIALRLGYHF